MMLPSGVCARGSTGWRWSCMGVLRIRDVTAAMSPKTHPRQSRSEIGKASKHRLTKQPHHAMPSILAGTAVLEKTPGPLSQAKGIVKLPIGEQSGVRGDPGTVELQLHAAVEIDPQMGVSGFTRRVTRGWLVVVLVSH